jgi:hypothetical protein
MNEFGRLYAKGVASNRHFGVAGESGGHNGRDGLAGQPTQQQK